MSSNRCIYALKAILELAKREGSGPISIGQIAHAQGIPARFLEAILRQLRQAGLTESVRGKDGGYLLGRPAEAITMGEVLRLMEGDQPLSTASAARPGTSGWDVFAEVSRLARKRADEVYDSFNFRQLADQDRQRSGELFTNYTI